MEPAIRKRLAIGILIVVALVMLLSAIGQLHGSADARKPKLGLMTSLPLKWAEGNVTAALDISAMPAPVYTRLSEIYRIDVMDNFDALKPEKPDVLLMVQPRAFAPDELVKIDAWVRQGGHLLVFADPALQWESQYPLGDVRRPLFTSLLSPLFGHWGIELVLPMDSNDAIVPYILDGHSLRTSTPGAWQVADGVVDAKCRISDKFLVADCAVGEGRALLVADADLLDAAYWSGTGVRGLIGVDDFDNIHWMLLMLRRLRGIEERENVMGGSG